MMTEEIAHGHGRLFILLYSFLQPGTTRPWIMSYPSSSSTPLLYGSALSPVTTAKVMFCKQEQDFVTSPLQTLQWLCKAPRINSRHTELPSGPWSCLVHFYCEAFPLAFLSFWNVLWFSLPMASQLLLVIHSQCHLPRNTFPNDPSNNHSGTVTSVLILSWFLPLFVIILVSLMLLLLVSPN